MISTDRRLIYVVESSASVISHPYRAVIGHRVSKTLLGATLYLEFKAGQVGYFGRKRLIQGFGSSISILGPNAPDLEPTDVFLGKGNISLTCGRCGHRIAQKWFICPSCCRTIDWSTESSVRAWRELEAALDKVYER